MQPYSYTVRLIKYTHVYSHTKSNSEMKANVILAAMVMLACSFGIQAAEKMKGSGKVVTRTIEVSEYDVVDVRVSMNGNFFSLLGTKKAAPVFNYTQSSGKAALQITLDDNLFAALLITSTGGELKIRAKDKIQIEPSQFIINGNSKQLRGIHVSGSLDFVLQSALESDKLQIGASGSSDVIMKHPMRIGKCDVGFSGSSDWTADNLTCDQLTLSFSGSSDANLAGRADKVVYNVSGSSDVRGYDFVIANLECNVSGSSDIQANVTTTLKASVSGGSDVYYKGNPTEKNSVSGGGSIKRVN